MLTVQADTAPLSQSISSFKGLDGREVDASVSLVTQTVDVPNKEGHAMVCQEAKTIECNATVGNKHHKECDVRQSTIAISALFDACANMKSPEPMEDKSEKGYAHLHQQNRRRVTGGSLPTSPEKSAHKKCSGIPRPPIRPPGKASVGTKSSSAPSSRSTSPLKPPRIAPRMTKAAMARNEANRKRLESIRKEEHAHWEALPNTVKRSQRCPQVRQSVRKDMGASVASAVPDKFVSPSHAQQFRVHDAKAANLESAIILSGFNEEDLAKREGITSQSIWSMPKIAESLEDKQTSQGKRPIHSEASRNNSNSLPFSDDPFFQELSKLDDGSLTSDDLDVLRSALLQKQSSSVEWSSASK